LVPVLPALSLRKASASKFAAPLFRSRVDEVKNALQKALLPYTGECEYSPLLTFLIPLALQD